ncbi:hypothetical protein AwEntero_13840 [Enterobacterales bacterium]|nr:hypothetical protein AwEntero_13840 [Enterobacterales bacterium]
MLIKLIAVAFKKKGVIISRFFLQLNHLRRIKNEDRRGETPAGETQAGPDA